jgi:hypothetical protein
LPFIWKIKHTKPFYLVLSSSYFLTFTHKKLFPPLLLPFFLLFIPSFFYHVLYFLLYAAKPFNWKGILLGTNILRVNLLFWLGLYCLGKKLDDYVLDRGVDQRLEMTCYNYWNFSYWFYLLEVRSKFRKLYSSRVLSL